MTQGRPGEAESVRGGEAVEEGGEVGGGGVEAEGGGVGGAAGEGAEVRGGEGGAGGLGDRADLTDAGLAAQGAGELVDCGEVLVVEDGAVGGDDDEIGRA